jgi:hypothetical protein
MSETARRKEREFPLWALPNLSRHTSTEQHLSFMVQCLLPELDLSIYLSICLSLYLSIYLSVYLWLYSLLLYLGRVFNLLILYTVGTIPWTGDQPVATEQQKHRINADRHSCFEWDSNPRSQCASGWSLFIFETARPATVSNSLMFSFA